MAQVGAMAECEERERLPWDNSVVARARKINLVVCGQKFTTTDVTLRKYPGTRLADLAKETELETEYFFDRDADIFREVLRFYRTGVLHMPKGICSDTFREEIKFWGLSAEQLAACCDQDYEETEKIEKQFNWFELRIPKPDRSSYRYNVWVFLTHPAGDDNSKCPVIAKLWACLYFFMTITQTIVISLSSHPSFRKYNESTKTTDANATTVASTTKIFQSSINLIESSSIDPILLYINYSCSFFFIVEVTVRFLCCPDKKYFCRRPLHILDLTIAIVELINAAFSAATLTLPDNKNMLTFTSHFNIAVMFATQMRVFRLLGYATMYSGLRVILLTLYQSWKEIALLVIVLAISVLIFGPIVYYADIENASPNSFSHIFIAYWWVIVTMTTVGYGDFYPGTLPGYLFAGVVMLIGLMLTALPVAIVGANFYTYYEFNKKREKRRAKAIKKDTKIIRSVL